MTTTTGCSVYKFKINITGTNNAGLVDSEDEYGTFGFMNINDSTKIMNNANVYGDNFLMTPGVYGNRTADNYCSTVAGNTAEYSVLIDRTQGWNGGVPNPFGGTLNIDFGENVNPLNGGAVFSGEFLDNVVSATNWLFITNTSNNNRLEIYYLNAANPTTWQLVTPDAESNYSIQFTEAKTPGCFVEGTKLSVNIENNDQYVNIEDLRKGDLVNTYLHGKKAIKFIGKGELTNNPDKWNNCVRRLPKTDDMTDDLFVTGAHSILVDELSEKESEGMVSIYGTADRKIDDKTLLLSWVSEKFEAVEGKDNYTYYHLVLEHEQDEMKRYGIWANGVLTESQCEKHFLDKTYELL